MTYTHQKSRHRLTGLTVQGLSYEAALKVVAKVGVSSGSSVGEVLSQVHLRGCWLNLLTFVCWTEAPVSTWLLTKRNS